MLKSEEEKNVVSALYSSFLLGLFVKKPVKDKGFRAEANCCTKMRKKAQICLRNPQTFVFANVHNSNFSLETLDTDTNCCVYSRAVD